MSDYNRAIIEEFRANEGRVGGNFEGRPLLLLTTTGARSCRSYTKPLVYLPDDGRLVVFASKGGAPTNPDWYHNLMAHPDATIEVGTDEIPVRARLATPEIRFRDRFSNIDGLADLVPHVGAFQRFMPGIRMTRHGDVRHCQGTVLAEWIARGPDGQDRARGTNVFSLGADRRIRSVTGFMAPAGG